MTVTTPANRSLTKIAAQTVAGTVSDPAIASATLYLNGSAQTPAISVAPDGSFSKVVTLTTGANTIEVRATDTASNTGTSGVVSVTLDSTAPTLTIGLSDPTDSITITVTANEALTAAPTVTADSTNVTMTVVAINKWSGTYGSSASPIAAADYTVTAVGTDQAGNSKTKTATFTKETIDVDGVNPTSVTTDTTTLEVETNGAVSSADISVTSTTENPSGNVENPEGVTAAAGAFVEIVASSELSDNLKQIYIRVDYNEDDLPEGTDESTLRLYLWDEETGTWEIVPGSGVNTTENYIYGTVTHLSQYGGFGSIPEAAAEEVAEVGGVDDWPSGGGSSQAGTFNLTEVTTAQGRITQEVIALSEDKVSKLTIAKNTIAKNKAGSLLHHITMKPMTQPPATPADSSFATLVYDFGPDGATFDPPVTLTITYDPDDLPKGVDEKNLIIAMWDSAASKWVELDSTINPGDNTITAPVSHFTAFTVVASTHPASFTVSELTVTPGEVNIKEKVTISVLVSNSGDLSDSYKATLKIDNKVAETKEVTVAGHDSEKIVFTTAMDAAGTYTINVDGLTGKFVVERPSAFTTSTLSITPAEVNVGQKVTISVVVSNTGDISGSYKVTLNINNTVEETEEITLKGRASQKVTFTTTKGTAGTYTVNINGVTGKFVVARPSAFTTSTLSITPAEVNIGQEVTISAVIGNTGDTSGSYKVTLKINNTVEETEEITLKGGASQKVTFTTTKGTAGTYTVNVDGLTGKFAVKALPALPPPPPTKTPINWWLIGGICAAFIILVMVIWVMMRRRRD
ncbi:CARDB domain-containing protein [Chloroflexota bacterium]